MLSTCRMRECGDESVCVRVTATYKIHSGRSAGKEFNYYHLVPCHRLAPRRSLADRRSRATSAAAAPSLRPAIPPPFWVKLSVSSPRPHVPLYMCPAFCWHCEKRLYLSGMGCGVTNRIPTFLAAAWRDSSSCRTAAPATADCPSAAFSHPSVPPHWFSAARSSVCSSRISCKVTMLPWSGCQVG